MKGKFLLSVVMMSLLMISCGKKEKELEINDDITGTCLFLNRMVEATSPKAIYSVTTNNSGGIGIQEWVIEIPVKIKDDTYKGATVDELKGEVNLDGFEANVRDKSGAVIKGQKGFKVNEDDIRSFSKLLSEGKGAEGVIRLTHTTTNSKGYSDWFDSAESVDLL